MDAKHAGALARLKEPGNDALPAKERERLSRLAAPAAEADLRATELDADMLAVVARAAVDLAETIIHRFPGETRENLMERGKLPVSDTILRATFERAGLLYLSIERLRNPYHVDFRNSGRMTIFSHDHARLDLMQLWEDLDFLASEFGWQDFSDGSALPNERLPPLHTARVLDRTWRTYFTAHSLARTAKELLTAEMDKEHGSSGVPAIQGDRCVDDAYSKPISKADLAKQIGKSPSTLNRYIKDGIIPVRAIKGTRDIRVHRETFQSHFGHPLK
jgi:hypothetical protein